MNYKAITGMMLTLFGTQDQRYSSLWVIPEFPAAIILPLFMFFTLIAVALTKKIAIRRKIAKNN